MICGDFNLVLNPEIDCNNYKWVNNPRPRNFFINLMKDFNSILLKYGLISGFFSSRSLQM